MSMNGEYLRVTRDERDSLDWVRAWYEPLVPFFTAATEADEAVLLWLD